MEFVTERRCQEGYVLKTDILHREITHEKINENGGMISWAVR